MLRRRFIPPENSLVRSSRRSFRPDDLEHFGHPRLSAGPAIPYRRPKNDRFSAAVRSG